MGILAWIAGMKTKLIVYAVLTGLVGLTTFGGYLYIKHLNHTVATLTDELTTTQNVLIKTQTDLNNLKTNIQENANALNEYNGKIEAIEQETGQLQELFAKHDFGALVAAKPTLMEKKINAATEKELKVLETISKDEQ